MLDKVVRIFSLDLSEYVEKLWDKNIPIVHHAVIEAVGVEKSQLENKQLLSNIQNICKKLNFHVVRQFKHEFQPQGTSIVLILKESHLAIHTWPEKGYVHIDLVTCTKEDIQPVALVDEFVKVLKPLSTRIIKFKY